MDIHRFMECVFLQTIESILNDLSIKHGEIDIEFDGSPDLNIDGKDNYLKVKGIAIANVEDCPVNMLSRIQSKAYDEWELIVRGISQMSFFVAMEPASQQIEVTCDEITKEAKTIKRIVSKFDLFAT